jgi:hypothetical protein
VERRNGQLASVLRDACGIIFIEYYKAFLERLNDEIKKKRPHLQKVLGHQDNAPVTNQSKPRPN